MCFPSFTRDLIIFPFFTSMAFLTCTACFAAFLALRSYDITVCSGLSISDKFPTLSLPARSTKFSTDSVLISFTNSSESLSLSSPSSAIFSLICLLFNYFIVVSLRCVELLNPSRSQSCCFQKYQNPWILEVKQFFEIQS